MYAQRSLAEVAELVDAHDSGSCGSNPVEVQVLSSAPRKKEREPMTSTCRNHYTWRCTPLRSVAVAEHFHLTMRRSNRLKIFNSGQVLSSALHTR